MYKGDADYLIIENNEINWASKDTTAECSNTTSESGWVMFANSSEHAENVDAIVFRNNTGDACCLIGVKMTASDAGSAEFDDFQVYGNNVTLHCHSTTPSSTLSCGEWKGAKDLYIYNNTIVCTGDNRGMKTRASTGEYVLFNNVMKGCGTWNSQFQDDTFTNVYRFNNSDLDQQVGDANGFHNPPGVFRNFNNSMKDDGSFGNSTSYHEGFTAGDFHGYNHWINDPAESNGYRTYTFNPAGTDSGNHICKDSDACGANAAYSDCSNSTSGCDPGTGGINQTTYKLEAGSVLIDAGTNNPVGQGANTCSFTTLSGTIDCTLDRDGDDRTTAGSSWDIGADEYDADAGGAAGSITGATVIGVTIQ
jgi:hypothetical protein